MTKTNLLVVTLLIGAAALLAGVAYLRPGTGTAERAFPNPERADAGFRVALTPVRSTDSSGTVDLIPREDTVSVRVRLRGLRSGTGYNVHFHEGSCERGGGGGLMLEAVRSSDEGKGSSRTVVTYGELNPTMDHLVMVHRPDGHDVLCANLPAIPRLRTSTPDSP